MAKSKIDRGTRTRNFKGGKKVLALKKIFLTPLPPRPEKKFFYPLPPPPTHTHIGTICGVFLINIM